MDFWGTVVVMVRRWYIAVPAFFAILGIAAAGYLAIPVRYHSTGVLVLTTPLTGGTETAEANYPNSLTNPLLNFDRSLALAASIVIQQMGSPEAALALGITPGGSTSYQVTNGSSNPELLESGPFLFVEGEGQSPEQAQGIAEKAAKMATEVLDQRQSALEAPASTHIRVQIVVPPTPGLPLKSSPLRAAGAAGALAGLASLAAVYGFESHATHRRRRRQEKEQSRDGSDSESTDDVERHAGEAWMVAAGRQAPLGLGALESRRSREPGTPGDRASLLRDTLHVPDRGVGTAEARSSESRQHLWRLTIHALGRAITRHPLPRPARDER
jgi:hypothetical protein